MFLAIPSFPKTFEELAIYVVVVALGLLVWLVRAIVGLVRSSEKRTDTHIQLLTNHMAHDQDVLVEIKEHMGAQTELARIIIDEIRK